MNDTMADPPHSLLHFQTSNERERKEKKKKDFLICRTNKNAAKQMSTNNILEFAPREETEESV